MQQEKQTVKAIFANLELLLATIIWGSTFFITKNSLNGIAPITLIGYRFILASIIFGTILLFFKKKLFLHFRYGFFTGILLFSLFVCQTVALKYTTAINCGFITGLMVILVPVFLFIFWKVKLSLGNIAAVFIALAGLWLITGDLHELNLGDILVIISTIFGSFHLIYLDKLIRIHNHDPFVLSFQNLLTVGALSILAMLIFRQSGTINSAYALFAIIYLAIFATIIGFTAQFKAQQSLAPISVAIILLFEPFFAAIFSWTIGKETFLWSHFFGGLLIFIAMIFSVFFEYIQKKTFSSQIEF